MVPKFIITLFIVLGTVEFMSAQYASNIRCKYQWQCKPNECCSKRIFRDESYCVPRRKIGQICINNGPTSTLTNGVYDITCPCEYGLECKQEQYTAPNGLTYTTGNPRCRTSDFPGFGNPYTRPNYGSASAGAGASGGSYGYGNGGYDYTNYNPYVNAVTTY